ncbi:MAG: YdcF family protein [Candidatus Riflebacteria bacterium]|nr:YdcF family protein [Candidatus Riflebacteria bacterium]
MFFFVSKFFQAFFRTSNFILALLGIGCFLLWTKKLANFGRIILSGTTLFCIVLTLTPLALHILKPLEEAIPRKELPQSINGIITMGGIDPILSYENGEPALDEDAECLTSLVLLSKKYPTAKLLFTGGSGSLLHGDFGEASGAMRFFADEGIDLHRFIWETKARGTHEKAVNSYNLVHPAASETWVLITSGYRMPRTLLVFQKVGWNIFPYPVNLQAKRSSYSEPSFDASLFWLWAGLKEWFGLIAYRLTNRSNTFFP